MKAKTREQIIFLSYARQDEAFVSQLYEKLSAAGFKPWMDTKDILPGETWRRAVLQAIGKASFFLACLSHNSIQKRGLVQEEIRVALDLWRQKLDSDIFLIPVRLEDCNVPDSLSQFQWIDMFKGNGFERLLVALRVGIARVGIVHTVKLRSRPSLSLSANQVKDMLKRFDFFCAEGQVLDDWSDDLCKDWANPNGRGISHLYHKECDDMIIVDSTTGLMWQQYDRGQVAMPYQQSHAYIFGLNSRLFGGFHDWRLPTLEEAMSLMERNRNGDVYLDPMFDDHLYFIWTADLETAETVWIAKYYFGFCRPEGFDTNYNFAIAVRSLDEVR